MKRVYFSSVIPARGYAAINLFGFIIVRKEFKSLMTGHWMRIIINHESIHSEQYKELLFLPFLIWYGLEFLLKYIYILVSQYRYRIKSHRSNWELAYRSISLEQEAYKYETDYEYLNTRKRYNWLKYVFKLSSKK